MRRVRVSAQAARQIADITAWSREHFGEDGRARYVRLIAQALKDLAENPFRPGRIERPEIGEAVFTYHLRHSRERAGVPGERVARPRHFLLCRLVVDNAVEVGGVLHERYDLPRHIPEDFR